MKPPSSPRPPLDPAASGTRQLHKAPRGEAKESHIIMITVRVTTIRLVTMTIMIVIIKITIRIVTTTPAPAATAAGSSRQQ